VSDATIREAQATDAEALAGLPAQLGHPTDVDAIPERLERVRRETGRRVVVAGIGGRLIDEGARIGREAGCGAIEVTSASHRDRAHEFYLRRGYEEKPPLRQASLGLAVGGASTRRMHSG
jgi:GNAT superfamily N-acetyltransferase